MTFPVAELKFSNIMRSATATTCLVRLYRVDDGGLDVNGNQLYARTLKRERPLRLDAGWDNARILTVARQKLSEWAIEEGFNLTPDRLICSL